MGTEAT